MLILNQYDPRAQVMAEINFDWRYIVYCMMALPPLFTCNNSISLALSLCILTWTTPHGLNAISATPDSIYNVAPGSLRPLSETNIFCVPFIAKESSNIRSVNSPVFCNGIISLDFKIE